MLCRDHYPKISYNYYNQNFLSKIKQQNIKKKHYESTSKDIRIQIEESVLFTIVQITTCPSNSKSGQIFHRHISPSPQRRINGQYMAKTVYVLNRQPLVASSRTSVSFIRRKHEPSHSNPAFAGFAQSRVQRARSRWPLCNERPGPLVSLLLDPCRDYVYMNTKLREHVRARAQTSVEIVQLRIVINLVLS